MEAGVLAETRGRTEAEGGVVKGKLRPPGRDGERGSAEGAPERPKLGAVLEEPAGSRAGQQPEPAGSLRSLRGAWGRSAGPPPQGEFGQNGD